MNKKALAVVKKIAPTHKDWLLLMHIYVTTLSQRDLVDMLKWEAERRGTRWGSWGALGNCWGDGD